MALRINLTTTRGAIADAIASFVEPLDIFRIINLFKPRSWVFELTFDGDQRNHLHISATPALNEKELRDAFDGRIPALFMFDSLAVSINGASYVLNPNSSALHGNLDTFIEFNDSDETLRGQIEIVGFSAVSQLQLSDKFKEWILNSTWLGSHYSLGRSDVVTIRVFSNEYTISPSQLEPETEPGQPAFSKEIAIIIGGKFMGNCFVEYHENRERNIRLAQFGAFSPDRILNGFWGKIESSKDCGLSIELHNQNIDWYTALGPLDVHHLRQILESVIESLNRFEENDAGFRNYSSNLFLWRKQLAASKLNERQHRFETTQRVFIRDREYFSIPTCENELVALYMKLEASDKLPFDCRVFEYTSKVGIDALGNFRFFPTEHFVRNAPIEFEFMLENYLDHRHPPEQTALIICWDVQDSSLGILRPFPTAPTLRWLKKFEVEQREISVVLIKNLPGLVVKDRAL